MQLKDYTQANRIAWNEALPRHQNLMKTYWDESFAKPGFSCISDFEKNYLTQKIGITDKKIVHLLCNNGIELLSLKNLGASYCLGIDISDEAIKEAKERVNKTEIDVEFLRSDVFDIPPRYDGIFDIVYLTVGALGWLPDLNNFFKRANRLLKPMGKIFIYEMHPFTEMLASDYDQREETQEIIRDYFKKDPEIFSEGIDYIGQTFYHSKPQYWFTHTLSNIFMAVIHNGCKISHFYEFQHDVADVQTESEKSFIKMPLSFILIAEKEITY